MNGKFSQIITLVGIVLLVSGCKAYTAYNGIMNHKLSSATVAETGTPRLEHYQGLPLIHLYGSPTEMGMQYGRILKEQINSVVYMVEDFYPRRKIKTYLAFADKAEQSLPEDYKAYIQAMARASGADYKKLLAINMVPKTSCSVLAVWDSATMDGNLLMGRNADYNLKRINKALGIIVVKHPVDGYATVASSFICLAGSLTGINEKGVCFGNMLVDNSKTDSTQMNGLPIHIWMQIASEKNATANEMIRFMVAQKHMIPMNVICADTSEAIIAELGLHTFSLRTGDKGVLASSNYFYSPQLYNKPEIDKRFACLMLNARDFYGEFTVDRLQKAMYDARVPNKNLQCVIFDPSRMYMHVSMNKVPASKGPFTAIDINALIKN